MSGAVQLFFAWRVKILTSNIWMVGLVVATALAGTGRLNACPKILSPLTDNCFQWEPLVVPLSP